MTGRSGSLGEWQGMRRLRIYRCGPDSEVRASERSPLWQGMGHLLRKTCRRWCWLPTRRLDRRHIDNSPIRVDWAEKIRLAWLDARLGQPPSGGRRGGASMFSLMTWNLENFERPAANAEQAVKERYAGKLQQITELITSTGPDLDGGQEVLADPKNLSPPAFDDLRQALGGEWTGCLSRRPDPRGIRMGWLARGQLTNPTEVAVYPHQVPTTTVDDDDHRLQARGPAAPCSWRPSPKAPASSRWSRAGAGRRGPSSASRRPTGRCCRPCPGGGRRAST
jgi:hypothetical protein